MDIMNVKVATLVDTGDMTVTLNYLKDGGGDEIRIYFWDSDNEYIDDWAFDTGENIENIFIALESYKQTDFTKLFHETFEKAIIKNATIQQWIDAKKEYGEEYVNRIGDTIIITDC